MVYGTLVGREEESRILNKVLLSKQPEFVAIYGRRRIGKTFLVRQVYKDSIVFETSALHDVNKYEQIENFWQDLIKRYNPKAVVPNGWKQVFNHLEQYLDQVKIPKSGKKIIFIDELPWYDTAKSGFLSAITAFWNGYCTRHADIILVICGSAASWIIKKVVNDRGGLHNRLTRTIRLQPFTIKETTSYLNAKNIKLSDRDLLILYMLLGGIPYYFNFVEKGKGVPEILDDLFLGKNATLRDEFTNLYPSLFKNHAKHVDIIKTLSSKQKGMTRSEIVAKSAFETGGWLTETLEELVQCDFIIRMNDFAQSKSDGLYRLTDEYSRFYIKFLMNNNKSTSGTTLYNSQKFRIWLGYTFENFCIKHHKEIVAALGISGIAYSVHSYIEKGNTTNNGSQIDMLIDREDAYIHIIEAKFYDAPYKMKLEDKKNIIEKRNSLLTKTKKNIFTTLITNIECVKNEHYHEVISNEIVVRDGRF
jgi:uncharacterized protein